MKKKKKKKTFFSEKDARPIKRKKPDKTGFGTSDKKYKKGGVSVIPVIIP